MSTHICTPAQPEPGRWHPGVVAVLALMAEVAVRQALTSRAGTYEVADPGLTYTTHSWACPVCGADGYADDPDFALADAEDHIRRYGHDVQVIRAHYTHLHALATTPGGTPGPERPVPW